MMFYNAICGALPTAGLTPYDDAQATRPESHNIIPMEGNDLPESRMNLHVKIPGRHCYAEYSYTHVKWRGETTCWITSARDCGKLLNWH